MYYTLYAEDTKTGQVHPLAELRSKRFSRAMREAEKMEKARTGSRYFICRKAADGTRDMTTAAYLGVRRKPAPVGSSENQALQRATLRRQKPSARSGKTDWDSTFEPHQEG